MSHDSEKIFHFGFDHARAEELFETAHRHRKVTRGTIDWRKGYSPRTLATACANEDGKLFLTNMLCERKGTLDRAIQNGNSITESWVGPYKPILTVEIVDILASRPKGFKWEASPNYNEMLACAYEKWRARNNAYSGLNRLLLK